MLGANGIGKTTLLKCMIGFLPWNSGQSLLNGRNLRTMPEREVWKNIAYVPQAKGSTFAFSGLDMVLFGLLSVAMTAAVSRVRGRSSVVMLILSGVMITALCNAALSMLKYIADPEEDLPAITYWLMGGLNGTTYSGLLFGAPMFISLLRKTGGSWS